MGPGLALAILASICSGLGSATEAFGVRRAHARRRQPGILPPLLREPLYFGGLAVDLLGFAFTIVALQLLPLFLVQAIVASSVAVTAIVVVATGRPLGRPGWIALSSSVFGLVLLSFSAVSGDVPALASIWHWLLLGMALPLAALGALGLRIENSWSAPVLAFAAGLAFTCVAVSARGLDIPDPAWRLLLQPSLWAIVVDGILGTALFALALERGRVTVVAAITFTTNTVLPAAIGILVLGDRVRSGYVPVAAAGFVMAVGGAISLAGFTAPLPQTTTPGSKATTP